MRLEDAIYELQDYVAACYTDPVEEDGECLVLSVEAAETILRALGVQAQPLQ